MATRAAKATMDGEARKRMVAALDTLRERFGIEMPADRPLVRDPEYAAIAEREDMATILEQLVKATEPAAEKKPERVDAAGDETPPEAPEKPQESSPEPEQPKPSGRATAAV